MDDIASPIPFVLELPPVEWPTCALPDGMREAAQAIADHAQAPLPLAGFAVVSAVSHIAQRIADAERPTGGAMPSSLFALVLADSGDRKSECFRLAALPIEQAEHKKRQEHRQSCERILNQAHGLKKPDKDAMLASIPSDPRTLFCEGTVEAIARAFINDGMPAMSLSTDEGGQFFGGYSMTSDTKANACGMTRLFDGKGIERNRIGADSGSGFRFGVRFSLFIAAQPVTVREALADPLLRGQGLLPRFLFAAPESIAGSRLINRERLSRKPEHDQRLKDYWRTLTKLEETPWKTDLHESLELLVAKLDDEAQDIWMDYYNHFEKQIHPTGELTCIKAFVSRGGELARRLATIYAVWRHFSDDTPTLLVDGTDMKRACLLVEYSMKEWLRLQGGQRLSEVERDAYALLKFMQKKPERWQCISRSIIAQYGPSSLRDDAERRNAAISELFRRRWLVDNDEGICLTIQS